MTENRLGTARALAIAALSALTLGVGLKGSGRLSYHEAIWAEVAREIQARGDWLVPTLGGRPWLEKPPGATWAIAMAGRLAGGVDEAIARGPSAAAGVVLALGVATLAARRFGPDVGLLAGLVQASTLWLVARGRLAEADVPLAAVITAAMAALDRLRAGGRQAAGARGLFFGMLGASALAKGIGFGAALIGAATAAVLLWDRDRATIRALAWPIGWASALVLALAWPLAVCWRHPSALGVWALHVTDRLASHPAHFAGEPWWQYAPAIFWQTLPWTPLAMAGALGSWGRARRERFGADRLLWAWALAMAAPVSLATVRNGHYLIHALPPWSIWGAWGLVRLGDRLRARRGWSPAGCRRAAAATFAALGLAIALGYHLLGPRLDRRGVEWAFYEAVGRRLGPGEPLVLLYDDWDRKPYPSPFGPVPHDLAVRLFYLRRPAPWRDGLADLAARPVVPAGRPFAVIGRERDRAGLGRLGRVEALARGPDRRWDRAYVLFRVVPAADPSAVVRVPRRRPSAPAPGSS